MYFRYHYAFTFKQVASKMATVEVVFLLAGEETQENNYKTEISRENLIPFVSAKPPPPPPFKSLHMHSQQDSQLECPRNSDRAEFA
jgi:hypothetical protein